jgi:hypothetical protein
MIYSSCRNILLILLLSNAFCCKQVYVPPNIKGGAGYLVVDGTILNGQDSTVINLSRTQNITDSNFIPLPEPGATISIKGSNGDTYLLINESGGKYVIDQLNLNNNELYQLQITTANGNQYLSDSFPIKQSPPIDSLNWKQSDQGVTVFVNTHDPQNNTRYYRWEYVETYVYSAYYNSGLEYVNGIIIARPPEDKIYLCWRTLPSTELDLGTSIKLKDDEIFEIPVTLIPTGSQKLSLEYSILVRQYALTADAFAYWQSQKLNTEQLGTIFAPQPTQITGNLHCLTNPSELVIGYIGATTLQERRIFIKNTSLNDWNYTYPYGCRLDTPKNANDIITNVPVTYTPVGQILLITTNDCGDCRLQGGITTKPQFWPN